MHASYIVSVQSEDKCSIYIQCKDLDKLSDCKLEYLYSVMTAVHASCK